VVQAETGAGVNPLPAFRFLPFTAQGLALAPVIPFPNVPSIQVNDHLVRFQRQFQLLLLWGGLLIQLVPQPLSPLTLPLGFAGQGGAGQFNAAEMFEHRTGLLHRHLAGQQRGQVLHRRRVAGTLLQPQGGIGRHPPFAAAFAVAPRPLNGDRPKAGLEAPGLSAGKPAQTLSAHRTNRRRGIGLGLRAPFHALPQQALNTRQRLLFQMPQILITAVCQPLDRIFQGTSRAGRQHGQRFG